MPLVYKILIAVGIFILFFGLFVVVYIMDKRAKTPDNCAKDALPEGCASCMLSCSKREEDFEVKTLLSSAEKPDDGSDDKED